MFTAGRRGLYTNESLVVKGLAHFVDNCGNKHSCAWGQVAVQRRKFNVDQELIREDVHQAIQRVSDTTTSLSSATTMV